MDVAQELGRTASGLATDSPDARRTRRTAEGRDVGRRTEAGRGEGRDGPAGPGGAQADVQGESVSKKPEKGLTPALYS